MNTNEQEIHSTNLDTQELGFLENLKGISPVLIFMMLFVGYALFKGLFMWAFIIMASILFYVFVLWFGLILLRNEKALRKRNESNH